MNVEIAESSIHGLGVFARQDIKKGNWQYVYGLLCPSESTYGFIMDTGWWEPFPPWRYTNHSDNPNCVVYWDDEEETLVIEALRKITAGEELTINYGWNDAESDV